MLPEQVFCLTGPDLQGLLIKVLAQEFHSSKLATLVLPVSILPASAKNGRSCPERGLSITEYYSISVIVSNHCLTFNLYRRLSTKLQAD